MTVAKAPRFEKRRVQEWLELAERGDLALPSFQRSYVWTRNESIRDYLMAVFENRPTGLFLVLETNGTPQFASRSLKGIAAEGNAASELILDGQQRLTSLWKAFDGTAAVEFYVEVSELSSYDVGIRGVSFWGRRSKTGKELEIPVNAYRENLVPIKILRDLPLGPDGLGAIWDWCRKAVDDPDEARRLERAINCLQKEVLLQRDLHYCELDADTSAEVAVEIFIQSNKSSVRVNDFDIAVALALDKGEEDLRDRISEFNRESDITKYYFNTGEDEEAVIAPLGEWLLFSACMTVKGVAPKKQRFEQIVREVFSEGENDGAEILNRLLTNVERALHEMAEHGIATRDMLPSLPALHVLAALQPDLDLLAKATEQGIGNRLVAAYLWRSFFTYRYESKANDRLFDDYKGLQKCIANIANSGTVGRACWVPIFDETEYPLPDGADLGDLAKPVPWIKRASRQGRAVAILSLCNTPRDWVTGEQLTARRLRELSGRGNLDRHHVFPRQVLKGSFRPEEINHGLNGVVLGGSSNKEFSRKRPLEYLGNIVDTQSGIAEQVIRERVESHMVPYDILMQDGELKDLYPAFISARAEMMAAAIRRLGAWPGDE